MAICPHCQTKGETEYGPCPRGDGYYLIAEADFLSHSDDSWLGRRVGERFVIASVLGQGAMGEVYKAYQEQVDRMVAIKLFDTRKMGPGGSEGNRERFVQEAKVLAKLSHPNCVTLYDFGYDEERAFLYIAMEYVGGISLRRAVRRGVKIEAVIEIIRQVLTALREAHALNIVHRDLKPENIILSYRRTSDEQIVKVLDFGIAKLLHGDSAAKTVAGQLFGTPAYMSPEQCRGETDVMPATDIYSLGCMAFELITGHLPYEAAYPLEMVRLHQEAEIPPVKARGKQRLPEGLDRFVQRCLAKKPEDRFSNAAAALAEFQKVVGSARAVELAGGMGKLKEEHLSRRVTVPRNRISGAELNPTGTMKAERGGEILSPRVSVQKEEGALPSEGRITDTIQGATQPSGSKKTGAATAIRGSGGSSVLVVSAAFVVLFLFVLVGLAIYFTI